MMVKPVHIVNMLGFIVGSWATSGEGWVALLYFDETQNVNVNSRHTVCASLQYAQSFFQNDFFGAHSIQILSKFVFPIQKIAKKRTFWPNGWIFLGVG